MNPTTRREVVFAIPGDLDTPTGGYVYDRRVIHELQDRGVTLTHMRLGSSFPHPTEEDTLDAATQLASSGSGQVLLIDGLALGALEPEVLAQVHAPIVALVHHPLALEGHLDSARRSELHRMEQENLARCVAVIVTSDQTAEILTSDYGVPAQNITVARPGTDRQVQTHELISPPLIVSVGSQSRRKGHDVLIEALSHIDDLPWQAVIAGSVRDEAYSTELHRMVHDLGLDERVRLIGAVSPEQLQQLYSQASVFALATRFEGYGMVFDEAMTYGLPIVSCDTGAVPDTVAEGAGLLVPVDDPHAFSEALRSVLADEKKRAAMATSSQHAGQLLPTWSDTADIIARVLNGARADRMEP
jgi:glycosyltransferase involved in cell wall biosynthesis